MLRAAREAVTNSPPGARGSQVHNRRLKAGYPAPFTRFGVKIPCRAPPAATGRRPRMSASCDPCRHAMASMRPRSLAVVSDFAAAGDQPAAIDRLIGGIGAGLAHQTLLGVTGSGKTFTMAKVIEKVGRPALVLAPNKTLAAQLYGEMREFFPHNAVEYFVSYYDYYQPEAYVPRPTPTIEKDASINDHIEQMRLSATKALLEHGDCIIVATVSSIYGLGDPVAYHGMVCTWSGARPSTSGSSSGASPRCSTRGTRSSCIAGRTGCRGEVIDVYPAESEKDAVRIELFDDEIENLSHFDPLTGEVAAPRAAAHDLSQEPLRHCRASGCWRPSRRSRRS